MVLTGPVYVKLFDGDHKKLVEIADEKDLKVSYLIRKIINKYMADNEQELREMW